MKINNIRPNTPSGDQMRAYLRDVENYQAQKQDFTRRKCPACNSDRGKYFSSHHEFNFEQCQACFTVFMNPGPTKLMVDEFYQNSSNYDYWAREIYPKSRDSRRLTLHTQRSNAIIEIVKEQLPGLKKLRVLEIGAGTGDTLSVLRELSDRPIDACAVEPNPSMKEALEKNGVEIYDLNAEDCERFDLVVAFEVLEHFLNPSEFMQMCLGLLKPNGIVILSTPNAHSIEVQMLKSSSTTIDVEHISLLTPAGMHSLSSRMGFNVLEIQTPGHFDMELIALEKPHLSIQIEEKKCDPDILQKFIVDLKLSSHMQVVLQKSL